VPFAAEGGVVTLEIESTPTADLYRIHLVARYLATGRAADRSLEGFLWRP